MKITWISILFKAAIQKCAFLNKAQSPGKFIIIFEEWNHKEFNWIQWWPKEVQILKNQKNTDTQLPAFYTTSSKIDGLQTKGLIH